MDHTGAGRRRPHDCRHAAAGHTHFVPAQAQTLSVLFFLLLKHSVYIKTSTFCDLDCVRRNAKVGVYV